MNFKDLQFTLGKMTTNVKSQVARNNPLQNQDTKGLNLWLFEERNDLSFLKTSNHHHGETNKAFSEWISEESVKNEDQDDYCQDINDIGSALYALSNRQIKLEQQYIERYQLYRRALKSIREKELHLATLKEKTQTLEARITHLKKTNSSSKKLSEFESELAALSSALSSAIPETIEFKRFILKQAFHLKFNALQEYAEKTAILAGFGKYIVDQIDCNVGGLGCDMILLDAIKTCDGWKAQDQRPTFVDEEPLIGSDEEEQEDAAELTPQDIIIRDNSIAIPKEQHPAEHNTADIVPSKETNDSATATSISSPLIEEEDEREEKEYFDRLFRVSSKRDKRKLSSEQQHRSYAEFQNQFSTSSKATGYNTRMDDVERARERKEQNQEQPISGTAQLTEANAKSSSREKSDDEYVFVADLEPPPAYSSHHKGDDLTIDEKK